MMDSQETASKIEEEAKIETKPVEETAEQTTNAPTNYSWKSQTEIVERLKELSMSEDEPEKQELEALKQNFYKQHKAAVAAARDTFIENGGLPEDFMPEADPEEGNFKTYMNVIKEKRAKVFAEREAEKEKNLERKLAIIERIKVLATTPDEANNAYKEFKELQAEWKEIKNIPIEKANELWKNYQLYTEQFYDLLKINSEFREYDFKKNLEAKTKICETAEKLAESADVISAFQQLQNLHTEYKEIGPVAKELREELWTRFKAASTVINKKHQQHFDNLKAKEEDNLARKTELCEKIETIDTEKLTTFAEWDAATKEIISLQTTWKTIGFAPQKMNVKIFERFRSSCDKFFEKKTAFFKSVRNTLNDNLAKKKALCEKAESLKDSEDWKATTDLLIQLQKDWKTIGAIPRKYSDDLWKRFNVACDAFFENKAKVNAAQHGAEKENLEKKKTIIEQLKTLVETPIDNMAEQVRALTKEWNETGHVPFKEKDAIYGEYKALVDKLYKDLNISVAKKRLNNFKNSIHANAEKGGNAINRERERLLHAFDNMRNEIKTYENNIGFLSSNSKKGNSIVDEMNKKVTKLKDELNLIRQKIAAIDEERKEQE